MLILSRYTGQAIHFTIPPSSVEREGTIIVTEVRVGGIVKLAFEFPTDIKIHRDDIRNSEPSERQVG